MQTKDYDIVPVYGSCGGSGCPQSSTTLIIESEVGTVVNDELGGYCLECAIATLGRGAVDVRYSDNQVNLQLGDYYGYRVHATILGGSVSVAKVKLDSNQPFGDAECSFLYGYMEECMHCSLNDCNAPSESLPMAILRPFRRFITNHPLFPEKSFLRECAAACRTRVNIDRASFYKTYCHR